MTNARKEEKKVVVIGLDGATFDLIQPWVNKGYLPNLAAFMEQGVHGELQSTIHPISPQAWTSFMTGKNAGKHGIFDFIERQEGTYGVVYTNGSFRRADSIWRMLSQAGKRVTVINVPFTYPPEPVNGLMLAGFDAPKLDRRLAYPPELFDEIIAKLGRYELRTVKKDLRRVTEEDFERIITNRVEVANYLKGKYPCDFFMLVFTSIDHTQHIFWKLRDFYRFRYDMSSKYRSEEYRDIVLEDFDVLLYVYKQVDRVIEDLVKDLGEEATVFIMSDHGAGALEKTIHLDVWLEKMGLLNYLGTKENGRLRHLPQHLLFPLLNKGKTLVKRHIPRGIIDQILNFAPFLRTSVESYLKSSRIDWSRTKAFPWGRYGGFFINLKGREPEGIVEPGKEYEEVRDFICEKLMELKDPDTGELVVTKVYKREELYNGPYLEKAPDLIVMWKDYKYYPNQLFNPQQTEIFGVDERRVEWGGNLPLTGTHRLNGIFLAKGPNIKQGTKIFDAEITDLAPTILYSMGQPIPKDMDGEVLNQIFEGEFFRQNPPQYYDKGDETSSSDEVQYSEDEARDIKKHLKALGYID